MQFRRNPWHERSEVRNGPEDLDADDDVDEAADDDLADDDLDDEEDRKSVV